MSNYIDMADQIIHDHGAPCGNIRLGIRSTLSWLDSHPDQAPGRTITESELSAHEKGMGAKTRDCLARMLDHLGITVTPEPTNAEKLAADLREMWDGHQTMNDVVQWLNDNGWVKAPEGGADD